MTHFSVPGKPCSNNIVTRRVGPVSVKSREARVYQARVKSLAFAAHHGQPMLTGTVAVLLCCWNVKIDADNISKCILDGMQGVVYKNDSQVVELTIRKYFDKEVETYVAISVEEVF